MASLFAVATAAAARTRERRGGVTPVSNIWTRLSCSTRVSPPRIPDRPASTAARRVGDVEALGQMRARPPASGCGALALGQVRLLSTYL